MRWFVGTKLLIGMVWLACPVACSAELPEAEIPKGYQNAPRANAPVARQRPVPNANARDEVRRVIVNQQERSSAMAAERALRQESKRILEPELKFAKTLFELSDQQVPAFQVAVIQSLPTFLNEKIAAKVDPRQRRAVLRAARESIQAAVLSTAKDKLGAEQVALYQAEVDKRSERYRQICVMNFVVMIDEILMLTPEQREHIVESLLENWQPSWDQTYETLLEGNGVALSLPEQFITPFLNEGQKLTWRNAKTKTPRGAGTYFNIAR